MINILHNDLKTLISSSSLVPEEQYCIIDYVTTVSKANYTSAGYRFDIVVTALNTNTLYEYATLLVNSTETYFDANAFLLYNIKYNVNNEIPGYLNDWVDANGKGCIYYMTDNKGNEAPFDFKNIKHNGKFLFNNTIDGSDTSQTISEYNSVKEVIEDGVFKIPQVSFNDECHSVTIDTNASEVSITECSNLQIGNNCSNSIFATINNVVIGNDVIDSELTLIDGGEIGDNNNGIIATNQTNLIIKDNNTNITLGSGSNGVIIDSNNTNVTIGTNAKDVYINGSKTINLGDNIEQFNISSSYDVVVANDCKLFNLTETNHLTSTSGCQSITTISNDYITLTESVTNVTISEGLTNLILDGSKLVGNDAKTIIKQDEKVVVINEQTNTEVVLVEDGTTTSNPNSYITDSPSDGLLYGRKDGNWEEIDTSGFIIDAYTKTESDGKYETIDNVNLLKDIVSGNTEAIENLQSDKADKATTYTKTEIDNKISAVFRYKGSVPTDVDLNALTGMTVGDVYNVTATGDNYAWTGTEWDKLAGEVDLSAYLTSADASNTYETIENVNTINGVVSGHTEDIEYLKTNKANTSHTHTKGEVGLSNVDNTSDINKPISNATQTALNGKANTSHTHTKSEVGLANVDNTTDLLKPISNATQGALDGKLPMKGKATTNLQVGQSFYNILNFMVPAVANTQRELTINTKIPFSDVYSSGTITISGIAYYKQSPFELTISYRIYGGEVYMPASGVIISGPWQPVVKWFNSGGFLCLAFIDADPMDQMSMKIDVFNKSTSAANYMDGWTWASTTGIGDATNIPGAAVVLPLKITQITNAQLPGRLQEQALRITDWNTATTNGFYQSGPAATNVPVVGKYILGQVWNHDTTGNCTQEVHVFVGDGSTDTQSYRRDMNGGTWGSWYKVLKSQEEIVATIRATNVSESQLPERLRTTAQRIYNWNTITETGWYQSYSNDEAERVATNAPIVGWLFGHVVAHISTPASAYCTQEVWQFSGGIGMKWKRTIRNGVPDANWIQVYETASELNSLSLPVLGKPSGELQLGRNYYNVASFVSGGGAAVDEVVIYTRLTYNSNNMPVIKINGYCYVAGSGKASNIDLQIMYYVAGGNIVNDGVVSNGTFTPTVKLFKHTVSGTDYIAVGLQGLISYLQFTVDYQNHWSAINQSAGWTVASQNGGTSLIEGKPNLKTIRYNLGNKTDISTIPTTWSALKSLRDAGTLVPGQSYKITDYMCTTVTTDTRSAGKQFDIIVTALSTNKLSENASAVQHGSDAYFENARLESWQLKYCIDNDTNRFAWAGDANGKGVIYYMKDNYNNELPYDFKNIQYFKNNVWVYTFGGTVDNSLVATCSNNKINIYISSNKQTLNNITFGTGCFSNTFGINCYSNTFGDNCYYNIFDVNCYSNTFGNTCHSNTFGTNCYSNTFGNSCVYNTFGDNCYSNTFGDSCGTNNFGDNCQSNIFGTECQSNTFGYDCYSNIFGTSCYSNTFGNVCLSNTFGNSCRSNTFGNECRSNKFYDGTIGSTTPKNYIRYIVLENGVRFNNFYSNVATNSSSYLQQIKISGLDNATQTDTIITLPTANTKYEWVVCYGENNNVIQYCPNYLGEYEKIKTITSTTSIVLDKQYKIYKYIHSSGNITSFSFSSTLLSDLGGDEAYTFEMEIQMPSDGTTITFPSTIVPLNGTTITLEAGKKNLLAFRTFDGTNWICNYQGYY